MNIVVAIQGHVDLVGSGAGNIGVLLNMTDASDTADHGGGGVGIRGARADGAIDWFIAERLD